MATEQPDPFCATTHWQLAYREAIDPDCQLVVRHSDDGLIQFTEHRWPRRPVLGPIERRWLFGANLLGASALDLLDGLFRELKSDGSALPYSLVISGLTRAGSRELATFTRFSKRYNVSLFSDELQCAASLEGGLDGFLSRRSPNLRRNLRRYGKRAVENGVTFERHTPTSAAEADAVFARMLAVELTSWKGIARCGMESPEMTRFYSIMLRRLARAGAGRVMFAVQDGRDVGFIFGGIVNGIYRGQQFSFDDRFAAMAIGNLMQFEQIAWLCEEGARRYDLGPLLGPSMEYKTSWTELQFELDACVMRPR